MVQLVVRTGDGLAVLLPDEAIERLGLHEGSEVAVAFAPDGRQMLIAPAGVDLDDIDPEFARQLDAFIAHYRPALVALAR
jgi:antitoxin component of MazEF toxin-antitoxin module